MFANSHQVLFFAQFLGREKYSFLKQHSKQIMPEPLQSTPSVCGYHTIYAAFHLFHHDKKKLQEFTMLMHFSS